MDGTRITQGGKNAQMNEGSQADRWIAGKIVNEEDVLMDRYYTG